MVSLKEVEMRRLKSVNLFLSFIFLLNTVLPVRAFSYEATGGGFQHGRVDESMHYTPVIYEKVRCPRCGVEFYYVSGKEGPHSHFVHYEIDEAQETDGAGGAVELSQWQQWQQWQEEARRIEKAKKAREEKSLFSLSKSKKDNDEIAKRFSKTMKKTRPSFASLIGDQPRYELRQKLTCPYDGYSFFPEGDRMEEGKLKHKSLVHEEPSIIETSFAKSIPFGVSKGLTQFGYDLFEKPDEQEKKEKLEAIIEKRSETLDTLGMLKAAFSSGSEAPGLSFQSMSQTVVVPISPDYVVGPGDTLIINIWGSVQESFPAEVDREGKIMLPKAGPLYVWGLKLKETEARIKRRLDQYYTNFYMDLSMGKLRDIQVYVMGEVGRPGTYKVSSQASIFQALYEAGGPTKLGSLRKIKLIHTDGKEEKIDLYPFLLQGKKTRPARVRSGDTIFVPTIGDVVAIAGNVKRPAIYETKSEIPLQDLLSFSGGITPTGDLQRLQVERIQDNERRIMLDIELRHSELGEFLLEDINMRNGDFVIVSPIVRLKHDFVSIIGNVERPGDYALSVDMKASDLINRAKGFLPGTYLHRAEIARVTKDRTRQIIPIDLDAITLGEEDGDIFLNEWDILLIYSESQIHPPAFAEVNGAVNRPGKYEISPKMKISDLIFKAGGVKPNELVRGAELFHIMPGEQPVVREIGIKVVSDMEIVIDKDIILRAGDALFVKSEPRLTERKIVAVRGEVNFPGTYSIREGERLSSLIERAGGFTEEAFLSGAVFNRKSIKEAQEKLRESFIDRENRRVLEEQQSVLLRRESGLDRGMISESMKMRRGMLDFIESVEIEGRMVIKLDSPAELKGSKYDILLEDGDILTIPQPPSAVAIMGSVNNPASVYFEPGRGVEYYIRRSGGLTRHADKKGIYVIKANGEAHGRFMMSKKIQRGDTIIVPQEFKYWTPPGQLLRDTIEMLSRIIVGVGIIAALD